jgi:hypothetical protein
MWLAAFIKKSPGNMASFRPQPVFLRDHGQLCLPANRDVDIALIELEKE